MKKVLVIILSLISISNSDTLINSIDEIEFIKGKVYLIKKIDEIIPLTKDTIINVINYKNKKVVTLLSGSAKLIIKD